MAPWRLPGGRGLTLALAPRRQAEGEGRFQAPPALADRAFPAQACGQEPPSAGGWLTAARPHTQKTGTASGELALQRPNERPVPSSTT